MTTLEEMDKAIELANMFENYATPERYIKELKAIDKDAYEDVMRNAQAYFEESHEAAFRKVKSQLIKDAEADKEKRDKRAEKARNRRADSKRDNKSGIVAGSLQENQQPSVTHDFNGA